LLPYAKPLRRTDNVQPISRAWLLVLAALSTSALAKAPETVNIGYQKANIFALLKYRGTLDESLKKQGIAVRWVEFPAGPQMLEGLNVGSIDLAATGDAPPAFAQAAQADLVYLAHSPLTRKRKRLWCLNSRQSTAWPT
jgi:sulfonate transport system substrate-binding protein